MARWFGAFLTVVKGLSQREHTPFRGCIRDSRKILYGIKKIESGISKQAAMRKRVNLQAKNLVAKGEAEYRKALKSLVADEIQAFYFVMHAARKIIKADLKIRGQLPHIDELEKALVAELQGLVSELYQMDNISKRISGKFHRPHFAMRDLLTKSTRAVRDVSKLDSAMDDFRKGLENHIREKLESGHEGVNKLLLELYGDFRQMLYDTFIIMHLILDEMRRYEIEIGRVESGKSQAEIKRWVQKQITEIAAEVHKEIGQLKGVAQVA